MADIHVLEGDGNVKWVVVFHFDIPDAGNAVGVKYRTALVNSGLASASRLPDGDGEDGTISAEENAALAAGEKWEHRESVVTDTQGETPASQKAMLQRRYARAETAVLAHLQRRLQFFGYTEART